jgi:GMP synthase (glutamine-hydrolysing)
MILIIDMNWKKDSLGFSEFVWPIALVVSELEECVIRHYAEIISEDTDNCNQIILSGVALKDNVAANQPEKFHWIKNVNKPVLGICAGMQAIGIAFGFQLTNCLEIGMTQITTLQKNSLFSDSFSAYSLHKFSVESSTEFEVLAKSEQCIQVIKHKKKPIYGVLFHPEVRNSEIIKRFIQLKQ